MLLSCWQYKPGDFLAVRRLNYDAILDDAEDDNNWVDPRQQSGSRSHPGDVNEYYSRGE